MRLGKFVKNFQPGLHFVIPFISRVYRVDTRVLTIDLGRKEVMTKDLSPTVIEAIIQYRVEAPEKSMFRYEKYRNTLSQISHTTMRKLALEYDLEQLIRDQVRVNDRFKAQLEKEFNPMGIVLHRTEIKEIDPVGPVKAAIEDRIAAEKERQAMILRADGRKRALIMEAEGRKHIDNR
ncbi:MAG: SPFH domain-containing protein [Thermoplasmatota archaeon]